MTPSTSYLDQAQSYTSHDKVIFGNGTILHVSHIGTTHISPHIPLKNSLLVPKLSKKLFSVSQLTDDYPIDVLFY